jgi:hypothetical protein
MCSTNTYFPSVKNFEVENFPIFNNDIFGKFSVRGNFSWVEIFPAWKWIQIYPCLRQVIIFYAILGRYLKLFADGMVDILEAGGTTGVDWGKVKDGIKVVISKLSFCVFQ